MTLINFVENVKILFEISLLQRQNAQEFTISGKRGKKTMQKDDSIEK